MPNRLERMSNQELAGVLFVISSQWRSVLGQAVAEAARRLDRLPCPLEDCPLKSRSEA